MMLCSVLHFLGGCAGLIERGADELAKAGDAADLNYGGNGVILVSTSLFRRSS
jgi:hypothetical protein